MSLLHRFPERVLLAESARLAPERIADAVRARRNVPGSASWPDHAVRRFPWLRQETAGLFRTLQPAHPEKQSALACWKKVQGEYVERPLLLAPNTKEYPTIRLCPLGPPIRLEAKRLCGQLVRWNAACAGQIRESIQRYHQEARCEQDAALPAKKDRRYPRVARTGPAFPPSQFAHSRLLRDARQSHPS